MGNRIEPFAALFWALCIVLAHILEVVTQPAGLATLNYLHVSGKLGSI